MKLLSFLVVTIPLCAGPADVFSAIRNNDLAALKKADVTGRDRRGNTPLQYAAGFGSVEAVRLLLDAGAVAAVLDRRKSLLPAGIVGAVGDFESGDVVDLVGPDGVAVARGFVGHDAADLPGIIGKSLADLPADLRHEVVHADDLIAVTAIDVARGLK